jgi:hypothetical protein
MKRGKNGAKTFKLISRKWDSILNFMYHLGEKNLIPFQEIGVHFQQKKP